MKKFLRKFFSFATVVCVIYSVLSVGTPLKMTVSAASESDLTFELNGDGKSYYVASCNKDASGDLTIPSTYNSLPVRGIGGAAFLNCTTIKSITIPGSVTSIEGSAFSDCYELASITLPDSVTSIGEYAFEACRKLTSVTIPNSVTSIGEYAFLGCESLTSVTIPDGVMSIGEYAFANTAYYNNSGNWENDVLYIGNHLIEAKGTISGDYVIKDGTKTIADSAFDSCKDLTTVTIPDSVTSIGERTFQNCESLTTVNIPDGVTSIGEYAFNYCKNLTTVTIPDSVTSLGEGAFNNTAYYNNSGNWENDVLYIGNHLIKAKETVSGDYVVKDSTKTIADKAFSGCSGLSSVTIGNRVTSIGDSAFKNSPNVTVRCYIGSYAQTFAEKNGIKYSLLELIPGDKTFISASSNRIFTEQSGKNAVDEIVTSEIYSVMAIPSFVNGTVNYYGTGSAIGFLKNGALEFIYKLVVYGDLNGDSTVDVLDVAIAEKVVSKTLSLDGDFLLAADYDSSGDIGVTDYQQIVNSALK